MIHVSACTGWSTAGQRSKPPRHSFNLDRAFGATPSLLPAIRLRPAEKKRDAFADRGPHQNGAERAPSSTKTRGFYASVLILGAFSSPLRPTHAWLHVAQGNTPEWPALKEGDARPISGDKTCHWPARVDGGELRCFRLP